MFRRGFSLVIVDPPGAGKMVTAKVWVMKTKFHGAPKPSDFEIKEEELPPITDGEILAEAVVWSVDPYNRAYASQFPDGTPMIGFQIAKVVESKNPAYPVGKLINAHFGWRTHTIYPPKGGDLLGSPPYLLPAEITDNLPASIGVGVLGMPGMTAYFGLTELCKPKAGETLVVNAAAGAVGSAVGQIGKILGMNVIGYAGTDEKVDWLKSAGFDHAYNYKKVDLRTSLKEAAPKGVDCFFDNVGGLFAIAVYEHMNRYGRIAQCGSIGQYNATSPTMVPCPTFHYVGKELSLHGFIVSTFYKKYPPALQQMAQWIAQGKLKYQETPYHGFDKMPQALIEQLEGKNNGKVIILPA